MRKFIYPYVNNCKSAKLLADTMGIKRLKREGSTYRWNPGDTIINWGASHGVPNGLVLNHPGAVDIACHKLRSFKILQEAGVSVPKFTTDREVAKEWSTVVCMTKLRGADGEGTLIWDKISGDQLPEAKLYTEYIKKIAEYRINVVKDLAIDVVKKVQRNGANNDFRLRTTRNGCEFIRNGISYPECVIKEALKAVKALGLDFGGVDVIYNKFYDRAFVLEVNTAPQLTPVLADKYKEAFEAL